MASYRDDFYRQPELYDLEYEERDEDVPFYKGLARDAGEVLELGCGTGRLTLPMAETGASVVSVDIASRMLERLRGKLEGLDLDVEVVQADFRYLDLGRRFQLVVLPFNAIHHVFTAEEILELFRRVGEHLEPGGRFALDLIVPDDRFYDRDPEGVHELRHFPDPQGGRMTSWENGWYDRLTQVNHVRYHYRRANGRQQVLEIPMRMYYPQEMLGLVRLAGWRMLRCDQDFNGTPLGREGHKMVLVLAPRDQEA
jgi:SAM-dependent methyltransferase